MRTENKVFIAATTLTSLMLVACARQVEPSIPVPPTPILLPTSPVIPTARETPTIIFSPDDSRFVESDRQNQRIVREAKSGEDILLAFAKITHIGRIKVPFVGEFYLAAIGNNLSDEQKIYSFIENPDCIYDELRRRGELGEPKLGVWTPENVRLNEYRGKVVAPYSINNPFPWLETESIDYTGNTIHCPKNSQLEQLANKLKISVQKLAELSGKKLQELLERIK